MSRLLEPRGSNLILLGTREPAMYGRVVLTEIDHALTQRASGSGAQRSTFPGSHEGARRSGITLTFQTRQKALSAVSAEKAICTHSTSHSSGWRQKRAAERA